MLPYFGGPRVDAPVRSLRMAREVEPGWWRFEMAGRAATPVERAEPADLSASPRVRGYVWTERLVREGGIAEPLHFLPAEELSPFTPASARRWVGGELIFEQADFDSEAVLAARRALEDGRPLAGVKGVPAELRAAFGLALSSAASRRARIPASPAEIRPRLAEIAEGGPAAAERVLRELDQERTRYRREQEARQRVLQEHLARAAVEAERDRRRAEAEIAARVRCASDEDRRRALRDSARDRIEEALEEAGARLVRARGLEEDRMEVVWRFMEERLISIVDGITLQVIDSGICLGHPAQDQKLTLESLPAVVREAIQTGRLVLLRHDEAWD